MDSSPSWVGDQLVVGSQGIEYRARDGQTVLHRDRMWVKMISCEGAVTHHNWTDNYLAVREAAGVSWPGYLLHEAVCWSPVRREWTFLPRRMSREKYSRQTSERMGANIIITADETFTTITNLSLGRDIPGRGFSSCKFIPGTEDRLMVGLKTEEVGTLLTTYVTVFDIKGRILLSDTKIGNRKYEGLEFL